jgi:hypothetical protein
MGFFSSPTQTRFVLLDTTETTSASTAFVNSPTTITLPIGTYVYEGLVGHSTDSTTAGGNVEITLASGYAITAHNLGYRGTTFFGTTFNNSSTRVGTNSEFLVATAMEGGASSKALYAICRGILVLTALETFGFKIAQRTTTDASNPAKLMNRSFLAFTKV